MGANFVAREVGWHMPGGWMQGDDAANAWFAPVETFPERFDAVLGEAQALGFAALDVWNAHLNWSWATERHLGAAGELLSRRGLRVTSLAGSFGNTLDDLRAACRVARAVGAPVLGGGTQLLPGRHPGIAAVLREHGVRLGIENHRERTPEELLVKLGPGDEDVLGVAFDTGWFATQGFDVVRAVEILLPRIFHVHMKDIKPPRKEKTGFAMIDMGHETCRLGAGVVPIAGCVESLLRGGYGGDFAVEHEPEDFDPADDCRASLVLLRGLLAG